MSETKGDNTETKTNEEKAQEKPDEENKPTEDKSREIISYIRERDEARNEAKRIQNELSAAKSKLYDAQSRIEELERALSKTKQSGKGNAAQGAKGGAKNAKSDNKKGKAVPANKKLATENISDSTDTLKVDTNGPLDRSKSNMSIVHPPITGKEELSEDTYGYYWEIANRFPHMKMQQILDAEKKFSLADINGDGVIDRDELDKVLTSSITMFTQQTIEELIKEIDQDDNGTLEFVEILTILDKASRRKLNIPTQIQKNHTAVCSIQ